MSRSYTYVFQRPWQYLWYSLVAVCYGAAVVFFIGFMGSFMVYLSKWGVAHTPFIQTANREPSYLFAYAPTSFGWRTLLLNNVVVDGQKLVQDGEIKKDVYDKYVGRDESYRDKPDELSWWNKVGAGLVAIWVGIVFLLVVGFGYSFFWSASTIIYLLMRRSVDTAELDEVYLEEDDQDGAYAGTLGPQPTAPVETPPAKPGTQSLQLVEAPMTKTPEPVVTTTEARRWSRRGQRRHRPTAAAGGTGRLMVSMKTRIQKWGNSLALRIPKAFAAEAGLRADGAVELTLVEGTLVVQPIKSSSIMLDELLARLPTRTSPPSG